MNKEIDHKEILELGNSLSNAELAELITQQSHRLWVFVPDGGDRVLDARMNGACIQINVGVDGV
tara:strand:+ start:738 stop:929 length:192 start_codon:yes stop_codon:yes gene_type:complete